MRNAKGQLKKLKQEAKEAGAVGSHCEGRL